jgi:hypothetical protein
MRQKQRIKKRNTLRYISLFALALFLSVSLPAQENSGGKSSIKAQRDADKKKEAAKRKAEKGEKKALEKHMKIQKKAVRKRMKKHKKQSANNTYRRDQ